MPRPHHPMGLRGSAGMVFLSLLEFLANLPGIWRLRRAYRAGAAERAGRTDPWVACVSDNLDEVNGIALASRIQLRELRAQGHHAFLFGVAFHTREPRREDPDQAVVLGPGRFSCDQAGYPHSEVVVPRLEAFLEFLHENPVDLVEFETPGPVSSLCLFACKAAGIPTLSHYRTDILVYTEMLIRNRFGRWFVQAWTKGFTRVAGPVIVPSEAYRRKVAEMGIPAARIRKLPRGVDLSAFHPRFRDRPSLSRLGVPEDGLLLLYVGRVSAEKNLAELATAFIAALQRRPDLRLAVVGDGPFRAALEKHLGATGRAHFTGVLTGHSLARAFASADLFVFPSLTDTFGNSVVEALASGLPCLVSDEGGPCEIVRAGECGEIFSSRDPHALRNGIASLASDPDRLRRYAEAARARAEEYSYAGAAAAFMDYYRSLRPGSRRSQAAMALA